jgi:hypothetical protein
VVLLCGATYLVAEGIYSIVLWDDMDGSLAYKTYDRVAGSSGAYGPSAASVEERPADLPIYSRLATRAMVEALLPQFAKAGIAMGDVPREFNQENLERVAVTSKSPEGCHITKPNLHKTTIQLRSNEFKLLSPPTLFFDDDATLSDDIKAFLADYGLRSSALHTNEFGERITVPAVSSARKVLVAGDSIAFGLNIGDQDTLASQFQSQDATRQYVTVGVPGGSASDIVCNLERSSQHYHGQIDGLIYVYSQTDFSGKDKYGAPDEFLNWLKQFAERENISDVTVVMGTNLYTVAPHLIRSFKPLKDWYREASALREGVLGAGYKFISITDLALEEASKRKTDFAAFAMFMDGYGHLSPYGASLVVDRIRNPKPEGNILVRAMGG